MSFKGKLSVASIVAFPGIARLSNRETVLYNPYAAYTRDAGYVFAEDHKFQVFVYSASGATVFAINGNGVDNVGINVSEGAPPITMVSGQTQRVVFSVTKTGPLAFSAAFAFATTECYYSPVFTITGTRPLILTDQPRPIDINTAMQEAYAAADLAYTIYDTLEFASTGTADTVRIVYSDEDLTTPQGVFSPCKFECTLPDTEGAVRGQMQITVGYLPKSAQVWLRRASQSRGKITVRWRQYLAANAPPDAEYPIPLEVVSVEQNPNGATATALFPDLINMPFPRRIMTTKALPGGII